MSNEKNLTTSLGVDSEGEEGVQDDSYIPS